MVVLEAQGAEIDRCFSCGGIWLDEGELEILLGEAQEVKQFLDSFAAVPSAKWPRRKCPICGKKMNQVSCGREHKVVVDECPKQDGVWCDRGELESILQMGCEDSEPRVLNWLQRMFKIG